MVVVVVVVGMEVGALSGTEVCTLGGAGFMTSGKPSLITLLSSSPS